MTGSKEKVHEDGGGHRVHRKTLSPRPTEVDLRHESLGSPIPLMLHGGDAEKAEKDGGYMQYYEPVVGGKEASVADFLKDRKRLEEGDPRLRERLRYVDLSRFPKDFREAFTYMYPRLCVDSSKLDHYKQEVEFLEKYEDVPSLGVVSSLGISLTSLAASMISFGIEEGIAFSKIAEDIHPLLIKAAEYNTSITPTLILANYAEDTVCLIAEIREAVAKKDRWRKKSNLVASRGLRESPPDDESELWSGSKFIPQFGSHSWCTDLPGLVEEDVGGFQEDFQNAFIRWYSNLYCKDTPNPEKYDSYAYDCEREGYFGWAGIYCIRQAGHIIKQGLAQNESFPQISSRISFLLSKAANNLRKAGHKKGDYGKEDSDERSTDSVTPPNEQESFMGKIAQELSDELSRKTVGDSKSSHKDYREEDYNEVMLLWHKSEDVVGILAKKYAEASVGGL